MTCWNWRRYRSIKKELLKNSIHCLMTPSLRQMRILTLAKKSQIMEFSHYSRGASTGRQVSIQYFRFTHQFRPYPSTPLSPTLWYSSCISCQSKKSKCLARKRVQCDQRDLWRSHFGCRRGVSEKLSEWSNIERGAYSTQHILHQNGNFLPIFVFVWGISWPSKWTEPMHRKTNPSLR